jgi:hypothetical protein
MYGMGYESCYWPGGYISNRGRVLEPWHFARTFCSSRVSGLQWADVDHDHSCTHIRRSAWYGKLQSTKSKTSSAPITLPDVLANVLSNYKQ